MSQRPPNEVAVVALHIPISSSHWRGLSWGSFVTLGEGAPLGMEIIATI